MWSHCIFLQKFQLHSHETQYKFKTISKTELNFCSYINSWNVRRTRKSCKTLSTRSDAWFPIQNLASPWSSWVTKQKHATNTGVPVPWNFAVEMFYNWWNWWQVFKKMCFEIFNMTNMNTPQLPSLVNFKLTPKRIWTVILICFQMVKSLSFWYEMKLFFRNHRDIFRNEKNTTPYIRLHNFRQRMK